MFQVNSQALFCFYDYLMNKQGLGIKELLALNLKEKRRILGLSQAKLARKANTSTHTIAMIELCRNFPSPDMLERLAAALEVEPQELFSMPPYLAGAINAFRQEVLADLEQALKETVQRVIAAHLEALEENVLP